MIRRAFLRKVMRAAMAVPLLQQFIRWSPWSPWQSTWIAFMNVGDSINGVARIVSIDIEGHSITLDRPVTVDINDVIVQTHPGGQQHFTMVVL